MKLEVFFDYACPYCHKGYTALQELLPEFPDLEVVWNPCEAHPRPEIHGLHSDLCARGMYQAAEQNADLIQYHEIMYRACLKDQINIEDLKAVADLAADITDRTAFYNGLESGNYLDELTHNNHEAWAVEGFPAVPSLRMNGTTLPAVPGVGLTKEAIRQFILSNT